MILIVLGVVVALMIGWLSYIGYLPYSGEKVPLEKSDSATREGKKFFCFLVFPIVGLVMGFLCSILTGIYLNPIVDVPVVNVRNHPLVSFNDNFSLNGSFFLGCGTFSEKAEYVYYVKDFGGGIHLERMNVEGVIIYEDRVNDGLLVEVEKELKVILKPWYIMVMPEERKYEFHVPSGTVLRNFEADLQ